MMTYTITTDADSMTIEASDIDEAARMYDGRVQTMADLVARVTAAEGSIVVHEDDVVVIREGVR